MVDSGVARERLALHGDVRPQLARDWAGKFPLPSAVERFYQEIGPADVTIQSYGNPFFLPRLAALWKFQSGYRWHGLTGKPIEAWNDDWLVVADEGGDPFIFSRSTEAVLHAYHGEGKWDAGEMFPDLNTMAACLAELGAIVREAGKAFTDEDCCIRSEWKRLALSRLGDLLGSTSDAEAVLGALWWG